MSICDQGNINACVSRSYDNNFWGTGIAVNGSTINYGYDNDGLITTAGALALSRDVQNGLLANTALDNVSTTYQYSGFGELASEQALLNTTSLYDAAYSRDKRGRITQKIETITGVTSTYDYRYDLAGRLEQVTTGGIVSVSYGYDTNGNRLSHNTTVVTYDEQDRLLIYGTTKSILDKYNRRLKWLAEILDDVIIHAEKRLNKDVAGDIRNRDETIEIHRKCKEFRSTLPIKDDDEIDLESMRNFCEIFDIEFNEDDYK